MTPKKMPLKSSIAGQAKTARGRGRNRAQQYLDIAGVMILALDSTGHITLINKKGAEILGYSEEELLGRDWFETCIPERLRKGVKKVFARLRAGEIENVEYFENTVLTKTGEERILAFHNALVKDVKGKTIGTLSSGEDVTEKKSSEVALKESEEKYRSLVERASDGITIIQDNVIKYANQRLAQISGQPIEEIIGTEFSAYLHTDERLKIIDYYRRRMAGDEVPASYEMVVLHKDGHPVYVEVTTGIISYEGRPADFVVVHDITERMLTEEALRTQQKIIEHIAQTIPDVIHVEDVVEQRNVYINREVIEMLGYSPETMRAMGANFMPQFIHPDDLPRTREVLQRLTDAQDGEVVELDYRVRHANGDWRWMHARDTVFSRGPDGRVQQFLGVEQDITDRKHAEAIQAAIYEIARSVISTATLDELYKAIHLALENILPVENFYIALYDSVRNLLSFPYYVDQYDTPPPPQVAGHGLTEYVLRTRKPLLTVPATFAELVQKGEVEQVGTDSVDWLGVPLVIGDKLIGAMVVQTYTDTVRLGQREMDIMSFVSAQVALSIERKRAENAERLRTEELKALYDTSLDIISTHDLPLLLETIVERAASMLHAPSGGLYLCDPERREARCVVSYHTAKDYTGSVLKYGEGAAGVVAETGQSLIIDDYRSWSKRAAIFEQDKPFAATISVPMKWQGEVRGVIHVLDQRTDRFFTQADLALLSQFANQAAIAIENARLLASEREQRQRESALLALMRIAGSTLNLEEVMQVILQHLLQLVPCESGSVQLLEGDYLRTATAIGFDDESGARGRIFPLDEFLVNRQVIEDRQPVCIDDVLSDPRYVAFSGLEKALSFLGLPVIFKGKVIGMITLDSHKPARFKPADIELALAIANHAAIALENARLYEQVQRHANELEERVAERTAELQGRVTQVEELNRTLADLLNDLKAANQRLEQASQKYKSANAELESFAYSVSHDLKAPLRGINGYSRLLLDDYKDKLDDDGVSFLQAIRRATEQMSQLIEDLLDYSRLERRPLTTQTVDVLKLVENLLAERTDEINQRGVKVSLKITSKSLTTDVEGLSQALRNLLDNALKFTKEKTEPRIEIGGRSSQNTCLLWVQDNGIGFDMHFHDNIFEIFQRLHTIDAYPGTGIGLSIVRKVMQRTGGRAWAESEPGRGATFYLEFPI